jgi:hypothetical protein
MVLRYFFKKLLQVVVTIAGRCARKASIQKMKFGELGDVFIIGCGSCFGWVFSGSYRA